MSNQTWRTVDPKPGELSPIFANRSFLNGGELTKRKKKEKVAQVEGRICAASTKEPYDGKELQRTPGIPDSRFKAFALPSLRNGQLFYPVRPA